MPSKHRVFNMLITRAPVVTLRLCKEVTFFRELSELPGATPKA